MKVSFRRLLATCVVLIPAGIVLAADEITAGDLAGFYPPEFESSAISEPGRRTLVIPGFQIASTDRLYDFGGVEIILYESTDKIFEKKLEKLRPDRYTLENLVQQGFPIVLVAKKNTGEPVKIMADIGGQIVLSIDCYACKTRDAFIEKMQAFDLQGLGQLLD